MTFTRRHTLRSIPAFALAGSSLLRNPHVRAQDGATPVSTPDAMPNATPEGVSCTELVGTPVARDQGESLLELLIRTPVNTPLFPQDADTIRPEPWLDEGDTDLRGTVGGVLMQSSQDENRNFIGPGVYIVFPDEAAAMARLDEQRAEAEEGFEGIRAEVTSIKLAGHSGIAVRESDDIYVVMAVGPVIVSGLGDSALPGDPMLRAHVNCLALLDHLQSVMP